MPSTSQQIGSNRTGIALAPERAAAMMKAAREFRPSSSGDADDIAVVRIEYASQREPAGTLPPPATIKQAASTALKALVGGKPNLLLDKLGERLAFERTGTRAYEALLSKYESDAELFPDGPTAADIEQIAREEVAHFELLHDAITLLGGDPTVFTPSANVQATATAGAADVLLDPRFTLLDGLEAVLLLELADNECWTALNDLAAMAGENDLAARFAAALDTETQHLNKVRGWIAAIQGRVPHLTEAPARARPVRRSANGQRQGATKRRTTTSRKRSR